MDENESQKEYRKHIHEIRNYASESYDKLIVYLNSGALILSVGFVKDIVEITSATETKLLKLSWILFVLSLVIILASHRTANMSSTKELEGKERASDRFDRLTEAFNWLALFTLVAGIVLFLTFVGNSI